MILPPTELPQANKVNPNNITSKLVKTAKD